MIAPLTGLGISKDKIMELVKTPEKLKEYEDFVRNLPAYQRANYVDPNIIKGIRREWLKEQEALKEVNTIDSQIAQTKQKLAQVEEAIKQKQEEIKENTDGINFSNSKDMYGGNYVRTGAPVKLHTNTETKVKSATEWDKPTEWDAFRINHKDQGEITGP